MATVYRCGHAKRRENILAPPSGAVLNAIDYLEVIDQPPVAGMPRQETLLVHLFRDAPTSLTPDNVRITGGVRVTSIGIAWIARADAVTGVSATEAAFYAAIPDATRTLVVRTTAAGDFATYTLALVAGAGSSAPPSGFDVVLSSVDFSFKAECPTDFDCAPVTTCAPNLGVDPAIDYLAKDYRSFRRVMLDRLAALVPTWTETSAADPLMTVIEALAYAGDHLSYQQDAVATEAYLETARRRISVRRHARLLDYQVHDGACARAWIHLDVTADVPITPGAAWFQTPTTPPLVFEPLHAITARTAHSTVRLYTWGDDDCCLPRGATSASFVIDPADPLALIAGDVVIFEEALGPATGQPGDADPTHRHAVRLTSAKTNTDPYSNATVLDVTWQVADALPFPLCLSATIGGVVVPDVSVARANVVLVEHGASAPDEPLAKATTWPGRKYRPRLSRAELSQQVPYDDAAARAASAADALAIDPRTAVPAIGLDGPDGPWNVRGDLLASPGTQNDFVVEMDDDGVAWLRFGDGTLGRAPIDGLTAHYKIGRGVAGNVGRDAITQAVIPGLSTPTLVARARNPLAAAGGADPDPIDQVKLYAPQAFRVNERAVREADYAARAETYPDVQRAVAVRRWAGSWYAMQVVVDRKGGRGLDDDFRRGLTAHLDVYRLAGFDLELADPSYVPLDLELVVCCLPDFFRADVRQRLLAAFSAGVLPDGTRGFFHPDNFTFGQPLYLSSVIAAAMTVPGVEWVDTRDPRTRFQRLGAVANGELERQMIRVGPLEIVRLDNSPSLPENGRLGFDLDGGR